MTTGSLPCATWRSTVTAHAPLILPATHDALIARMLEHAGFSAFQVGYFAMVAGMHAYLDIDLEH